MLERMTAETLDHYRRRRAHGRVPASEALRLARLDTEHGVKRTYTRSPFARPVPNAGAPSHGERWIEDTTAAGLRHVGAAHDIIRSLRHTGWNADPYGEEVYTGHVWQLPARKGVARFVGGYIDPCNDGAARIDTWAIMGDDRRGGSGFDGPDNGEIQAARIGDGMAERDAEEAQDYGRAWAAGARWRELRDEEADFRAEALALAREARALRRKVSPQEAPNVCARLRADIQELWESIQQHRAERRQLKDGDSDGFIFWPGRPELVGAFKEGAGL